MPLFFENIRSLRAQLKPLQRHMKKLSLILAAALLVLGFLYYLFCLNHIGPTSVGIAYNSISGDVTVQEHAGWYATSPFVSVAHLSTLPMRVTIPSQATIINSKIVRFRPEGAKDFVTRQGFSFDLSTKMENIMLGYAYSGQSFPFLEIIEQGTLETKMNLPVTVGWPK